MVLHPLGTQSAQACRGVFRNALDHHHQVAPLHRIAAAGGVILGYTEPSGLETLDIHHHSADFGMKQFHEPAAAADEYKHVAVANVGTHLLLDNADQRIYALAHVRAAGAQMVAHRVIEAEHGRRGFG